MPPLHHSDRQPCGLSILSHWSSHHRNTSFSNGGGKHEEYDRGKHEEYDRGNYGGYGRGKIEEYDRGKHEEYDRGNYGG